MIGDRVSINHLAMPLVESLCGRADELRLVLKRCASGAQIIDAGIAAVGGIEAGRAIAQICLAGLGRVGFTYNGAIPQYPLTVHVHTSNPVLACLASQYAGWSLSHKQDDQSFQALGSGPGRALACREELFKELGYKDDCDHATLVLEVDQVPPVPLIEKIAKQCGVHPSNMNLILTPTTSLAGSVQVIARVLEVAMHKAHELGFKLEHIVDGAGSAPLSPPSPDFITAMGRTNDAILFAGQVQLFVTGDKADAQSLANELPSNTSRDYGEPFADVFKRYDYDFFQIDPMLFSPAQVKVSHLPSGSTFSAGKLAPELLEKSFNLK